MTHSHDFLDLVQEAKTRIREIDCETLRQKNHTSSSFLLIDVREDEEWAQGHLPNAQHLSKGILERDIQTFAPDKNQELILYCGGGFRSALAADSLQKMGYTNVYSLEGGYKQWRALDFPIEA